MRFALAVSRIFFVLSVFPNCNIDSKKWTLYNSGMLLCARLSAVYVFWQGYWIMNIKVITNGH